MPPPSRACRRNDRLDWMYQGGVMAKKEADSRVATQGVGSSDDPGAQASSQVRLLGEWRRAFSNLLQSAEGIWDRGHSPGGGGMPVRGAIGDPLGCSGCMWNRGPSATGLPNKRFPAQGTAAPGTLASCRFTWPPLPCDAGGACAGRRARLPPRLLLQRHPRLGQRDVAALARRPALRHQAPGAERPTLDPGQPGPDAGHQSAGGDRGPSRIVPGCA